MARGRRAVAEGGGDQEDVSHKAGERWHPNRPTNRIEHSRLFNTAGLVGSYGSRTGLHVGVTIIFVIVYGWYGGS